MKKCFFRGIYFFTLILVFTTNSNAQNADMGKTLISEGISLHDEGKYREAIEKYNKVDVNDSAYVFSQVEKALSYLMLEAHDTVILICEKALEKPTEHNPHLLETLGAAYDGMGDALKALEIYNKAIEKYPYRANLYFNKGITLFNVKRYEGAAECFKEVLQIDPLHASGHLNLGKLAAMQQQFAHAFLSLETFLLVEPNSGRSNETLIFLENLAKNYIDTSYVSIIEPFFPNDELERTDHILRSGMMLDVGMPSPVNFNASFIKQTEALIALLPDENVTGDFWIGFYGSFFKNIAKQGLREPFYYTMLSSTRNENVDSWKKGNQKTLSNFYGTGSLLTKNKLKRTIIVNGEETGVTCKYFESGELYGIGAVDKDENPDGPWQYYFSNAQLNLEGEYENGKKTGEWKYYNTDGSPNLLLTYKNDTLHGKYMRYRENGAVDLELTYKNGMAEGDINFYYPCGNIMESLQYEKDERNGPGAVYFANGRLKNSYSYKNNKEEGRSDYYYENGRLYYTRYYKNGKADSLYVEYFPNGVLSEKGHALNDEKTGLWTSYFINGNVYLTGRYLKGKPVGEHREYWQNGATSAIYLYNDSGKFDGITKYFDKDGKLSGADEYDADKLIKTVSYGIDGNILKEFKLAKDKIIFETHWTDGVLRKKGQLTGNDKTGTWVEYYRNGNKREEYNYVNNKLDGKYTEYYENGSVKSITNYVGGEKNGELVAYHINGNKKTEGQYKNGDFYGYWKYYFVNGSLKDKIYDAKNKIHGQATSYTVSGKLSDVSQYEQGVLLERAYYDSTGKEIFHADFSKDTNYYRVNGKGKIISKNTFVCGEFEGLQKWHYQNGNLRHVVNMYNSMDYGDAKTYYESGELYARGKMLQDNKQGKWVYYYKNGNIRETGNYFNDEYDSIWNDYYENGQLKLETYYFNGLNHGKRTWYDETGELGLIKFYVDDEIDGYQYVKADGQLTGFIGIEKGNGKITAYYKNGKPSCEQEYKNGLLQGTSIYYYGNGNLYTRIEFDNGEFHGNYKEYYANGQLKKEKNYFYGELHGAYAEFNPDGSPVEKENFKLGEKHGRCEYYKHGKLLRTEIYFDGLLYGIIKN